MVLQSDVVDGSPQGGPKTFLMVDMVGSTRSWEDAPKPTADVIVAFRDVWAPLVQSPSCRRHRDTGDGLFAVFDDAGSAASVALAIDHEVRHRDWPAATPAFRMALYTGTPYSVDDGNYGPPANRCQRLMEVGHGGQILAAETTVAELSPAIDRRFLGSHRLRDLTAAEPVYQLSTGEFPPIRSLDSSTRRLPRLRTATVGRSDDIRAVSAQLGEGGLTTLLGPGGVGKTRLALEAAAEASLDYARNVLADGLCFCDLAPISDGATLPEFVASCLEIPQRPQQSTVDGIVDHLRHRRSLLILDNCEHLLAACAELAATLLHRCPGTVMLATSRAPLGLAEERVVAVHPMSLPESEWDPDEIGAVDAVHLFLARARAANPELVVDGTALQAIGQICRQCDGLPLAIELIASRCRSLTPAEILDALASEGVTLPSSRPTAVERQRTIEHAIAWSYNLLEPDSRTLLNVASVFAPEFGLAALEMVSSGWIAEGALRRRVTDLVDMSMLESHPDPEGSRLRVLDTIRTFGLANLRSSGRRRCSRSPPCRALSRVRQASRTGDVDGRRTALGAAVRDRVPQPAGGGQRSARDTGVGRRSRHPVLDTQLRALRRALRGVLLGRGCRSGGARLGTSAHRRGLRQRRVRALATKRPGRRPRRLPRRVWLSNARLALRRAVRCA